MSSALFERVLALLICLITVFSGGSLPDSLSESASEQAHSPLYIPGVSAEDAILYFNEVCLDGEFINSGDPSYVQKWTAPIYYTLEGEYTDEDEAAIDAFSDFLNGIEGFPGIYPAGGDSVRNLSIYFGSREEMISRMGPDFENMDGGVTFWYSDDEIYDAVICCLSDLTQPLRTSVLLEEIYNGLGPIQDTSLRPDSLIYQEYAQPERLTPVDELILKLLYHPDMEPGMDAQQCAEVIRRLYY